MFCASNDRGPKSNCLLYISCISFPDTTHGRSDVLVIGFFHSNLISMKKGVARPCMPIKVKFLRMFTLC